MVRIRFSPGSSGGLARQIANGAPFDVFLSANEQYVRELADSGYVQTESVRTYATGRLGLYSLDGKLKELKELEGVKHVAIANPRHAPYGLAAEQALRSAGLWMAVQPKLILAENVRQAYEYARTRNADAAITAWTLVKDVGGVLVPATLHEPIRQTAGVCASSGRAADARRFVEFLLSAEGQAILSRYGLFKP